MCYLINRPTVDICFCLFQDSLYQKWAIYFYLNFLRNMVHTTRIFLIKLFQETDPFRSTARILLLFCWTVYCYLFRTVKHWKIMMISFGLKCTFFLTKSSFWTFCFGTGMSGSIHLDLWYIIGIKLLLFSNSYCQWIHITSYSIIICCLTRIYLYFRGIKSGFRDTLIRWNLH